MNEIKQTCIRKLLFWIEFYVNVLVNLLFFEMNLFGTFIKISLWNALSSGTASVLHKVSFYESFNRIHLIVHENAFYFGKLKSLVQLNKHSNVLNNCAFYFILPAGDFFFLAIHSTLQEKNNNDAHQALKKQQGHEIIAHIGEWNMLCVFSATATRRSQTCSY